MKIKRRLISAIIVVLAAYLFILLWNYAGDSYQQSMTHGKAEAARFLSASPDVQRQMVADKDPAYLRGLGLRDEYGWVRIMVGPDGSYWLFTSAKSFHDDTPKKSKGPFALK